MSGITSMSWKVDRDRMVWRRWTWVVSYGHEKPRGRAWTRNGAIRMAQTVYAPCALLISATSVATTINNLAAALEPFQSPPEVQERFTMRQGDAAVVDEEKGIYYPTDSPNTAKALANLLNELSKDAG